MLNERVALAAVRTPFVGVFACEGACLEAAVVDELDRLAPAAVAADAGALILGSAALTGATA